MGSGMLVLLVISGFAASSAVEVSPVEKVINLLEELKTELEEEGKAEAKTYDEFACFCKDTTKEKSDAIKTDQDNIEEYAADMQENTEMANAKAREIAELEDEIATLTKEIEKMTAMRESEKTQYEATAADLGKGVSSLEGAISDAKGGKVGLMTMKTSVKRSLIIADTLDLTPKHHKDLTAFLQTMEGEKPDGGDDYEFHADALIATFEELDKQFIAKKAQVDQEEAQAKKDFNQLLKTKTSEKTTAEEAKAEASEAKDGFLATLAEKTDAMIEEEAKLKDDKLYMKDLTAQCELKAREWDQQSSMRSSEVTALTKALDIITAKVQGNDASANKRALLQVGKAAPVQKASSGADAHVDVADADIGSLSFLRVGSPRQQMSFLAKKAAVGANDPQDRRDRALRTLATRSQQLKSPILAALAMKAAADPFLKVKKLIQELIEKLVTEAAEEATKKGWCDTEMGKAESDRNNNMDTVIKLNAKLSGLEATKASLEEEIATLTTEIAELNDALTKTTKARAAEKAENMQTLDEAKEGLAATKDAYDVLASFYKSAGKAKVALVQVEASPVQAPGTTGGAYKGNQGKAGGILAMLEVIISDFERTIKVTTKNEKEASKEFTKFERTTKASIASKETSKSTAEFDLKDTEMLITENMDDLEKHQKMLDDALKTLEDLKPACVDTGMSYADRVQKRRDEIDALKEALCQLDAEGVEDECK